MSLSSETSRVQYAGNGSSVTAYAVPFKFLDNDHVQVVLKDSDGTEVTLEETTHYTLTGAGEDSGGELLTVTGYDSSYSLTIYRDLPFTQPSDYESQGAFPAESHETALDRVTMLCQQLKLLTDQSFKVSPASGFPDEINLSASGNTLMGFDSGADFILWTASALRELLSLEGTIESQVMATWADDAGRAAKVPDYTSQVGVQTDDKSLWISTGTSAGNWLLFALDEDSMATDSPRRPATQQSLAAYLTSVLSDAANLPNHASRHLKGGADELDGDTVDIDTAFTNFTPDTTPGTVTDATHLGAVLKGVDNALAGSNLLQEVITQSNATASGADDFPVDNTRPQITEGVAFAALDTAFTPRAADSTLIIEVHLNVSSSTSTAIISVALFRDSVADALAISEAQLSTSGAHGSVTLRYSESAGSTDARTYKVRFSGGGTAYVNRSSGGDIYGGALYSSLKVTEIAA